MHQETVLITRCSSGIGRSTVLDFLDGEREACTTARNPTNTETLGERGVNTTTLDVTDQGNVGRVIDCIVGGQGRTDCFINNADCGQMGPVRGTSTGKVYDQFDVNVHGPHRLARAVLPHMRSRGDGITVNVSSVVDRAAFPGTGIYAGSKFALKAMTDALRAEVGGYGADTVLIEPGPVEMQFSNRVEAEINGNGDEVDGLSRSDAHEKLYRLFDDSQALGGNGPGVISSKRIAEDIVNVASSIKPWTCYQPGTVARTGVLARFLPDA